MPVHLILSVKVGVLSFTKIFHLKLQHYQARSKYQCILTNHTGPPSEYHVLDTNYTTFSAVYNCEQIEGVRVRIPRGLYRMIVAPRVVTPDVTVPRMRKKLYYSVYYYSGR